MKVKSILLILLTASLAAQIASAQKKQKPWVEWSKDDAQKMLEDSPWAKTQTDTQSSQKLFTGTANTPSDGLQTGTITRLRRGAVDQPVDIYFRVRLFSARPVRQALARILELQKPPAEAIPRLHEFAELKSAKSVVVTLTFESNEQAYLNSIAQTLSSATTATLINTTYLETNDGKRVFLEQYVPPGKDGFGARFIFPRQVDGAPYVKAEAGDVRFHAEYPAGLTIDRRFKISDLMYNGELEY
jgi:hypothetical protein